MERNRMKGSRGKKKEDEVAGNLVKYEFCQEAATAENE
jgi:hypothetical protein